MLIIPGTTGINLANEVAEIMDWKLLIPEFKTFSDGEQYLRFPEIPNDDILLIHSLYQPQDTHLFQLLNMVATLKRLVNQKIIAFIPYMCYTRADKDIVKGEAISSRTVLELLENVGIDHLITLDIHNPEIFNFVKKLKTTNIFPSKSIGNYIKNNIDNFEDFQIIAPDSGAITRAKMLAKELGLLYTNMDKTRDPITGDVNVEMGNAQVKSKRVILIDDILSTGASLIQSSSLLKYFDVQEIHVFVTHTLGSNAIDRLLEIGNGSVVSTNSIPSIIGKISVAEDIVSVFIK